MQLVCLHSPSCRTAPHRQENHHPFFYVQEKKYRDCRFIWETDKKTFNIKEKAITAEASLRQPPPNKALSWNDCKEDLQRSPVTGIDPHRSKSFRPDQRMITSPKPMIGSANPTTSNATCPPSSHDPMEGSTLQ